MRDGCQGLAHLGRSLFWETQDSCNSVDVPYQNVLPHGPCGIPLTQIILVNWGISMGFGGRVLSQYAIGCVEEMVEHLRWLGGAALYEKMNFPRYTPTSANTVD